MNMYPRRNTYLFEYYTRFQNFLSLWISGLSMLSYIHMYPLVPETQTMDFKEFYV